MITLGLLFLIVPFAMTYLEVAYYQPVINMLVPTQIIENLLIISSLYLINVFVFIHLFIFNASIVGIVKAVFRHVKMVSVK